MCWSYRSSTEHRYREIQHVWLDLDLGEIVDRLASGPSATKSHSSMLRTSIGVMVGLLGCHAAPDASVATGPADRRLPTGAGSRFCLPQAGHRACDRPQARPALRDYLHAIHVSTLSGDGCPASWRQESADSSRSGRLAETLRQRRITRIGSPPGQRSAARCLRMIPLQRRRVSHEIQLSLHSRHFATEPSS